MHGQERLRSFEEVTEDGWKMLAKIVDARRCYFWKFHGTEEPHVLWPWHGERMGQP